MSRTLKILAVLSLCVLSVPAAAWAVQPTYDEQIKPILREHCFNCHSPDKKEGDLDLTTYAGVEAGSSTGPLVDGPNPDYSTLYLVTTHQEEPHMPPKKPKIPEEQIAMLKKWIEGGIPKTNRLNFKQHVKPILEQHCSECHGASDNKADLTVTSYTDIMSGSSSGQVISPGDPTASRLYMVVTHQSEPFMPKGAPKLAKEHLKIIEQWIRDGALEDENSKPIPMKKPAVDLALSDAPVGKPSGDVAQPGELLMEPVVHAERPDVITALAHSPWAPVLAIGGQKQIILYNSDTQDYHGVIPFEEGYPRVLRFTRNGSYLLAAGGRGADQGLAALFDVKTGRRITTVGDELDTAIAADINAQQTIIAIGGPNRLVKAFNTNTGALRYKIEKHTEWVMAVGFSPDGVLLASGDRNGGLHIWEAYTGQIFYDLRGHKSAITALAWRDDSNVLASASEDGTVKLWEMKNGKQIKSFNAHGGGVLDVRFAHDGHIVTAGRDHKAKLFKPDGGHVRDFEAFPDLATRATFNHDDKRVIAGDYTGTIKIFDTESGKAIGTFSANPPPLQVRISSTQNTAEDLRKQIKTVGLDRGAADKQVKEAEQALTSAKNEIAKLEKFTKDKQQRVDAMNKQIKSLEDEHKKLRDELNKHKNELDKQNKLADEANKKLANEEKQLDPAKKQVEDLKGKVDAAEKQLKSAEENLGKNREDKKAQQAVDQAKKQLDDLRGKLSGAEKQLDEVTKKIEQAKAEAQKQRKQADEARKRFEDHDGKYKAHDKKLNDARAERKKIADDLNAERKKLDELKKSIPQLEKRVKETTDQRNKVNHLHNQLAEAEKNLARYRLATVYSRVYAAQRNLDQLKDQKQDMQRALDGAEIAMSGAVSEVEDLEKFIAQAPDMVKQHESQAAEAQKAHAEAVKVAKHTGEQMQAKQSAADAMNKQVGEAESKLKSTENNVNKLREQLKNHQDKLNKAQVEAKSKREAMNKLAVEHDEKAKAHQQAAQKAEAAGKQLADTRKQFDAKSKQLDELRKKLNDNGDNEKLKKQVAQAEDENKKLKQQVDELEGEHKKLTQAAAAAKTELDKLNQPLAEARKAHESAQKNADEAKKQHDAVAGKLNEAQKNHKQAEQTLAETRKQRDVAVAELEAAKKMHNEKTQLADQAAKQLQSAQDALAKLMERKNNAPEQLAAAKDKVKRTTQQKQETEAELAEAQKKIEQAEQALEKVEDEYKTAKAN